MKTALDNYILQLQGSPWTALAALVLLLAAAYGLGGLFYREKDEKSPFLRSVLGMNILAFSICCLGDGLFRLPPCILPGVLLIAALSGILRFPWKKNWLVRGAILFLGLLTLGSALTTPYAWDEQVYQVALLKEYCAAQSTAVLPDNPYSAFPSLPHFLMLPGVISSGLLLPRLLVWAGYLLLCGGMYTQLKRFGAFRTLLLLAAAIFSPLILSMNRECYMEIFLALDLMAAAMLYRNRTAQPGITAATMGILAGGAAAVKLTGGGVAVAIAIFTVFQLSRSGRLKKIWCFFVTAGGIMLPFYLRAWTATGNFLYPFGARWVSPQSTAALVEQYHSKLGLHLYGVEGIFGWLFGWLFAAYDWKFFDGIGLGYSHLPILVLGVWYWISRRKHFRAALPGILAMAAMYAFWCASSQQTRFLLPWYGMVLFWGGAGLYALRRNRIAQWIFILLVLGGTAMSFPWRMVTHYYYAWKYQPQIHSRPTEFLKMAERDPEHVAVEEALTTLPENARVLLLFERRTLFTPRKCRQGTPYFQEARFTPVPESAQKIWETLQKDRIDAIVVGASRRNPDYLEEYDPFNYVLSLHLRTLLRQGKLKLWKVNGIGDYTLLKVCH